jgi:hypothetical protein
MNTGRIRLSRPARALLLLGAVLACASAGAADKAGRADAQTRLQVERSMCLNGQTNQDRATCLQEAGAAYAEALRDGLDDHGSPYARNAGMRCDRLPDEDRRDCRARMQGQGTTTGSVAAGGIYRELVTRETEAPATVQPAAEAPAAPTR